MSLKFRLSVLVSVLLLMVIVVICTVAYVEFKENLLKNIDHTLVAVAEGMLVDLNKSKDSDLYEADLRLIAGFNRERAFPVQYRIWTEDENATLYTSDPALDFTADLGAENEPEIGMEHYFNLSSLKQYRAIWIRHSVDDQMVNVVVAHPIREFDHEMTEFLGLLLLLGGSMVLGIFFVISPIVAFGMRPVDRVAEHLHQITHRSLTSRQSFENIEGPVELDPFLEALRKMLARLNTAMQQQKRFITDASHELRTPLCILKSTLQMIRMKDRTEAEYINAIDDALQDIERMEGLLEQLLSLGRIDESKKTSSVSRVSLNALMEKLVTVFNTVAVQQGKNVICETHTFAMVEGNEDELAELFSNILDNALKYGPPEEDVTVSIDSDLPDHVVVCVHDTGGNIPPETLTHLFERFYRADASRARATGGSGLGLSIAKEIAIRYGGDIEIISKPDTGTSVFIRLPRLTTTG